MNNGYISVEIGGKQRGLKFAMMAFEMLGKRVGVFPEGELMTSQLTAEVVYAGLSNNCYVKEVETDFTFEDVNDWVEEMWYDPAGQEILAKIFQAFTASKAVERGKQIVDAMSEEDKKKMMEMIGMASNPLPSES